MSIPDVDLIEPERIAAVAIDDLAHVERQHWREHRRPRRFTAREAVEILRFECTFVAVCAFNVARGIPLSEPDLDRLVMSQVLIHEILYEATR